MAKFDVDRYYMQRRREQRGSNRSSLPLSTTSTTGVDLEGSLLFALDGRSFLTHHTKRQRIGNDDRPESRIKLRIRDTVNGYDESQS